MKKSGESYSPTMVIYPAGERNKGGNAKVRLARIVAKLKAKREGSHAKTHIPTPILPDSGLSKLADAYRPKKRGNE